MEDREPVVVVVDVAAVAVPDANSAAVDVVVVAAERFAGSQVANDAAFDVLELVEDVVREAHLLRVAGVAAPRRVAVAVVAVRDRGRALADDEVVDLGQPSVGGLVRVRALSVEGRQPVNARNRAFDAALVAGVLVNDLLGVPSDARRTDVPDHPIQGVVVVARGLRDAADRDVVLSAVAVPVPLHLGAREAPPRPFVVTLVVQRREAVG
ncbi:MAG: hypothetical protein R3B99_36010, partial [Polyangiales bacterium]